MTDEQIEQAALIVCMQQGWKKGDRPFNRFNALKKDIKKTAQYMAAVGTVIVRDSNPKSRQIIGVKP